MTVVTVFVSDRGALYLPDCLASYSEHVRGANPSKIIDDSTHTLGMAGAVQAGFQWALDQDCDYVLWVEEDFRFTADVDLGAMVRVLETAPHLAQVVLKRHAWSDEEKQAGGQIEVAPDDYTDCHLGSLCWVEHERLFSLNPSLIRREVLELGWPATNEAGMKERCLAAGYRFAYFGKRDDPPRCEHVGAVRGQGWRL